MRRILLSILLSLLLAGCAPATPASEDKLVPAGDASFEAVVLRVQDGDSLVVRRIGRTRSERLRLSGIDAPERGQAHGDESRAVLAALVDGKRVDVAPAGRDRYGRLLATVSLAGRDVGLAMIEGGHAWYYRRYRRDLQPALRKPYERAEHRAREAELGLWRDPAAQAPWSYRAHERDQRPGAGARERLTPS